MLQNGTSIRTKSEYLDSQLAATSLPQRVSILINACIPKLMPLINSVAVRILL